MDDELKKLFTISDKNELLDFVKEHLDQSSHCLCYMIIPENDGGIRIEGMQYGFRYDFELTGFINDAELPRFDDG